METSLRIADFEPDVQKYSVDRPVAGRPEAEQRGKLPGGSPPALDASLRIADFDRSAHVHAARSRAAAPPGDSVAGLNQLLDLDLLAINLDGGTKLRTVGRHVAGGLEAAQSAVKNEDLPLARSILERELAAHPENQDASFLLARVLSWQQQFDPALEQYDLLLVLSPNNADYLLGKGQALLWQGNPRAATIPLDKARQLSPDYRDVWKVQIQALLATSDPNDKKQAQSLLTEAEQRFGADEFKDLALAFTSPDTRASSAEALASRETKFGFTEVELGGSYEDLNNGRKPWSSQFLQLDHRFENGATAYGTVRATRRFQQNDQEIRLGLYAPLLDKLTLQGEVTIGPAHNVLPRASVFGGAQYVLAKGWVVRGGWRRSKYDTSNVNTGDLTLETYFSDYRLGYTLYRSTVESSSPAYSHAVGFDYNYGDRNFVGVIGAVGKEAEFIDDDRLLIRKTNSLVLRGRHWLNPKWAVTYDLGRHKLTDAFTRFGGRVGLRYRY